MKKIPLKGGDFALVDDEDYPVVSRYPWRKNAKTGYAFTVFRIKKGVKYTLYLHRLITGSESLFDHKNCVRLDCQKDNLRKATFSQNGANRGKSATYAGKPTSSQYKGVHYLAKQKKWRAVVFRSRKSHSCGTYAHEWEAAEAYNKKAKELFGEFSLLNKINYPI